MGQKGFIFDVNKCTGCSACQLACTIENQVSPQIVWRQINTFNPQKLPGVPVFHHSLACNHCIDPPCMKYCPALAFSKDPETGAVILHGSKCIGCKYCSWACPYDAPQYNTPEGVMEKCTFCEHRLDKGDEPACVAQCPTGALRIGDYSSRDEGVAVVGFPENGIEPAIEFVPLVENRTHPECADTMGVKEPAHDAFAGSIVMDAPASKVTLKTEWTLVVFTILAAMLVGFVASGGTGFSVYHAFLFAGVGLTAMVVSVLHLGCWQRAPRAVLNFRHSWLSREILCFSMFLLFGFLHLATGAEIRWVWWVALWFGFATLFSIDGVYSVTKMRGLEFHSARVVLTGLLVASLISGVGGYLLAAMILILKTVRYVMRKVSFARVGRNPRLILSSIRLLGSGLPVVLWSMGWGKTGVASLALVAIGELIDRCEFYVELEVQTPRAEMRRSLSRLIATNKKAG